jgi:hypothetical protein
MKACIVTLDLEDLKTLLQLPEGAEIDLVEQNIFQPGQVRFRLTGVGPEIASGNILQEVSPQLHSRKYLNISWEGVA